MKKEEVAEVLQTVLDGLDADKKMEECKKENGFLTVVIGFLLFPYVYEQAREMGYVDNRGISISAINDRIRNVFEIASHDVAFNSMNLNLYTFKEEFIDFLRNSKDIIG